MAFHTLRAGRAGGVFGAFIDGVDHCASRRILEIKTFLTINTNGVARVVFAVEDHRWRVGFTEIVGG